MLYRSLICSLTFFYIFFDTSAVFKFPSKVLQGCNLICSACGHYPSFLRHIVDLRNFIFFFFLSSRCVTWSNLRVKAKKHVKFYKSGEKISSCCRQWCFPDTLQTQAWNCFELSIVTLIHMRQAIPPNPPQQIQKKTSSPKLIMKSSICFWTKAVKKNPGIYSWHNFRRKTFKTALYQCLPVSDA